MQYKFTQHVVLRDYNEAVWSKLGEIYGRIGDFGSLQPSNIFLVQTGMLDDETDQRLYGIFHSILSQHQTSLLISDDIDTGTIPIYFNDNIICFEILEIVWDHHRKVFTNFAKESLFYPQASKLDAKYHNCTSQCPAE